MARVTALPGNAKVYSLESNNTFTGVGELKQGTFVRTNGERKHAVIDNKDCVFVKLDPVHGNNYYVRESDL